MNSNKISVNIPNYNNTSSKGANVNPEQVTQIVTERSEIVEITFFVLIEGNDPIVVTVKDDVNRPNNADCHSVLEAWKKDNYGYRPYDYWEIDTCEKYRI